MKQALFSRGFVEFRVFPTCALRLFHLTQNSGFGTDMEYFRFTYKGHHHIVKPSIMNYSWAAREWSTKDALDL